MGTKPAHNDARSSPRRGRKVERFIMEHRDDEEAIRRYLLGDVTRQEQDEMQDRLFVDNDLYNLLLMIENEITDDYLLDNLAPRQRVQFEKYFLQSQERRRRLRVAEELMNYASAGRPVLRPVPERKPNWRIYFLNPRFVTSAAMLILAAILIWLLRDRQVMKHQIAELQLHAKQDTQQKQDDYPRPPPENSTIQAASDEELKRKIEEQQNRADDLARRLRLLEQRQTDGRANARFRRRPGPENDNQLIGKLDPQDLWPSQSRGGSSTNQIHISRGAKQLLLKLNLEEDKYPDYQVEIKDADDREVKRIDAVKSQQTSDGKALLIEIPARIFKRGDYVITVNSATPPGNFVCSYQFRVQGK